MSDDLGNNRKIACIYQKEYYQGKGAMKYEKGDLDNRNLCFGCNATRSLQEQRKRKHCLK